MNGDGKPDIIASFWNSTNIAVLLNNGDGTFASPLSYAGVGGLAAIAIADINGDGSPDVNKKLYFGVKLRTTLTPRLQNFHVVWWYDGPDGKHVHEFHLFSPGSATMWHDDGRAA